jgi:hypothetical protein
MDLAPAQEGNTNTPAGPGDDLGANVGIGLGAIPGGSRGTSLDVGLGGGGDPSTNGGCMDLRGDHGEQPRRRPGQSGHVHGRPNPKAHGGDSPVGDRGRRGRRATRLE